MTMALEGGEGSALHPGRSLPPGKTRHPLYRRPGGPQGQSEQVRKISPPTEFNPHTVQPVASCYTDYAVGLYTTAIYKMPHGIYYNIKLDTHYLLSHNIMISLL